MAKLKSELEVQCPCCRAMLVIDTNLGRVISHKELERGDKPELSEASRILAEEARRREALFEQGFIGQLRGAYHAFGSSENFLQIHAQGERSFRLGSQPGALPRRRERPWDASWPRPAG